MPAYIYPEYGHQNAKRSYPFADNSSLTDRNGHVLPYSFIVDACLYPIIGEAQETPFGGIYLSRVDVGAGYIEFADSATQQAFGRAEIKSGAAEVYEILPYGRQVGIVVYGDPAIGAVAGGVRVFSPDSAALSAAAYAPIVQRGVRGFLLPNGDLVYGDVTFEGRAGVEVTSDVQNGIPTLRVDVVGVPQATPEDCGDVPEITQIEVKRIPGSVFQISYYSPYDLDLCALSSVGFDLDTICEALKERRRLTPRPGAEGYHDPCEEPLPPPEPTPPGDEVTLLFNVKDITRFGFVAPSSIEYTNPITVEVLDGVPGSPTTRRPRITTLEDAERNLRRLLTPPTGAPTVAISIAGLGKGQLS